jgi:hypothetical protein
MAVPHLPILVAMATRILAAVVVVCAVVASPARAEQGEAIPGGGIAPVSAAFPQASSGGPLSSIAAQRAGRTARNSVFIELGGNGLLYTLNYDRVVNEIFSIRGGIGYLSLDGTTTSGGQTRAGKVSMLGIPLLANYMLGSDNHKLELGAGMTLFWASGTVSSADMVSSGSGIGAVGTAVLGYRYVPRNGGLTFRIGFTPLFSNRGFLPWGGVSLGYVF